MFYSRAHTQTHSLADTFSVLWQRVSRSGGARDLQGRTELHVARSRVGGIAATVPFLGSSPGSLQVNSILPILNPTPAWPIMKLHWLGEISPLHPVSPWGPIPPNSQIASSSPLLGSKPHSAASLGYIFIGEQQPSALMACVWTTHFGETFGGKLLM